jgi:hypothetical protein
MSSRIESNRNDWDDVRVEEGVGGTRGEKKGEWMGCAKMKRKQVHYYYR